MTCRYREFRSEPVVNFRRFRVSGKMLRFYTITSHNITNAELNVHLNNPALFEGCFGLRPTQAYFHCAKLFKQLGWLLEFAFGGRALKPPLDRSGGGGNRGLMWQGVEEHRIFVQRRPDNIVVQKQKGGRCQCYAIDGFGFAQLIPMVRWSSKVAAKKFQKRRERQAGSIDRILKNEKIIRMRLKRGFIYRKPFIQALVARTVFRWRRYVGV
jgi:hypothetical protein